MKQITTIQEEKKKEMTEENEKTPDKKILQIQNLFKMTQNQFFQALEI